VQLRVAIAAAAALAACDRRRDKPPADLQAAPQPSPADPAIAPHAPQAAPADPATAPHAPQAAPVLRPVAELREPAVLVEGTRRIALWVGEAGWYEPDAGGLAAQPLIGSAIARTRAELGEPTDVFLGARPILAGGPEHRERFVRFQPAPREIALHGLLVQVAAAGPLDVWRYEHELRTELATVDASGTIAPLPGLPRIGPDVAARSPVGKKACAAPKVRDPAGAGDAVLALVTECHPAAPVRIATYRWPGPAREVATLGSLAELDLQIDRLLATRDGGPILVGRRGDAAVVVRIGPGGRPAAARGPTGVTAITHAAVADDGAVWLRTLGPGDPDRDRVAILRDGAPVALASPAGAPLRAESLALDGRLGIVVLAAGGAARWLLAERPPASQPLVLPAR
jgi:hypothetical protein